MYHSRRKISHVMYANFELGATMNRCQWSRRSGGIWCTHAPTYVPYSYRGSRPLCLIRPAIKGVANP